MWNLKMIVCLGLTSMMVNGICKACVLQLDDSKGTSEYDSVSKCEKYSTPWEVLVVGSSQHLDSNKIKLLLVDLKYYFESVENIEKLDISINNITEIDLTPLGSYNNLLSLNLSYRQIKQFTAESRNTFPKASPLTILYLNNNNLSQGMVFSRIFPFLKKLNLSSNVFDQIDSDIFYNLTNLEDLDLSSNIIESLHHKAFESLQNLQNLDLSHNEIVKIPPNLFHSLLELSNLNLSHNNIVSLDSETFYSLLHLQKLDLSHNKIINLYDPIFEYLPALQSLAINNNQIHYLDIDNLLLYSNQLKAIFLDNNRWICTSLRNIISKYHKKGILIKPGLNYNTTNVLGIPCKFY